MKKVSEAHFQKVLKRQKSANSTKKCSNDNFYKTLYFNRKKVFVIFWTLKGIYYLWRRQR